MITSHFLFYCKFYNISKLKRVCLTLYITTTLQNAYSTNAYSTKGLLYKTSIHKTFTHFKTLYTKHLHSKTSTLRTYNLQTLTLLNVYIKLVYSQNDNTKKTTPKENNMENKKQKTSDHVCSCRAKFKSILEIWSSANVASHCES